MDEDEALGRVRAADPAAGAEPDTERLARLTTERRSDVPDELAARRARRAPRWATVAAVTAGALVVGGAGYGLGRAGDEPAPPAAEVRADVSNGVPEPMAQEDSMAATDMSIAPGYAGRTTFTAQGLSDEAGAAMAWAYDGAAVGSAEGAARVAAVFGLEGEPRRDSAWAGWVVGSGEFTGPFLTLGQDGTAHIDYHDPAQYSLRESGEPEPIPAPEEGVPEGEGAPGSAGREVDPDSGVSSGEASDGSDQPAVDEPAVDEPAVLLPAPVQPQPEPADASPAVVPEGQAPDGPAGVVYETLASLGLDPNAAEYEAAVYEQGVEVADVVAHQLIDGRRTGTTWFANVIDGKIYTFTGPLAPLVELGEYDVVSATDAVERLGDARFGGTPVWRDDMGTMPMMEEAPVPDPNAPPVAPPAAGSPIAWPVTDVTIVSAEPALTQHYTEDGNVLLLPAYELSDAEGQTWSVLAVADHELAF